MRLRTLASDSAVVGQVAGAAAAAGQPLEEVAAVASQAAASMSTLGVALSVCTLPGHQPSDRCAMQGGVGWGAVGLQVLSTK
jgi:dihydroxyacetone kinase